jgi:hypothetical protein
MISANERMYEARIYVAGKRVYIICDNFDDSGEYLGCTYLTKDDSQIIEHLCPPGKVTFDSIEPFHTFD